MTQEEWRESLKDVEECLNDPYYQSKFYKPTMRVLRFARKHYLKELLKAQLIDFDTPTNP